ncbi:hypothetical protein FM036_43700 [Nostoc sp. HG1]|nr:hypothetical protein [Nostoc sp. HG1]
MISVVPPTIDSSLPASSDAFFTVSPPREFFALPFPVFTARAPGRLDVMGGISDYSGGTCLEWPLECATRCAVQPTNDGKLVVHSANATRESWQNPIEIAAADWMQLSASQAQKRFEAPDVRWARYVLGAFLMLRDSGIWSDFDLQTVWRAHLSRIGCAAGRRCFQFGGT